jgi:hypothetical protein
MSHPKIIFDSTIPESLLPLVQLRVEQVAHLFPLWCSKVVVSYGYSQDNVLSIDVQYEYRAVVLNIHPPFFEDDDPQSSLIHEIGHSLLKPLVHFGERIIEHFVEDDRVRRFLADQFTYYEEQVTEDIALFAKKITNAKTKSIKGK